MKIKKASVHEELDHYNADSEYRSCASHSISNCSNTLYFLQLLTGVTGARLSLDFASHARWPKVCSEVSLMMFLRIYIGSF